MATDIADSSTQMKSGCGIHVLYNGVFGRRNIRPRRTVSSSSIPIYKLTSIIPNSKLRSRAGSCQNALLGTDTDTSNSAEKPIGKTSPDNATTPHQRKPSNGTSTTTRSSSSNSLNTVLKVPSSPGQVCRRSLSKEGSSTVCEELDSLVVRERSKGSTALVRASSGNIVLVSHLANIKQPGEGNSNSTSVHHGTKYIVTSTSNTVMGNIMRTANEHEIQYQARENSGSLCRILSKRINPDTLKVMGNEEYKKGRFAEALALYDRAIAVDHNNASYRSNKSAALIGLGRLLEAVLESREAIRIDPSYPRAHHRLAMLYIRLGEGEKALYHLKKSGLEAKSSEISKAQILQSNFNNCIEAKKLKEWNKLLRETQGAISLGADAAPQIFSLQAEALLKLHRHQDADSALTKRPTFDVDDCTKFLGPTRNAQVLLVQAQVDMAAGRFDEAVSTAQQALQLDATNKEVSSVVRMIGAVSSARSTGNKLFKASNFSMASLSYTEGLESYDPYNSVLLCNRAACRFKLGQFEKAMEDCSLALNVRPSYTKARQRRAECNAKMERWEASIQDYEILIRGSKRVDELEQALLEAQLHIKNRTKMKMNGVIMRNRFITSPAEYVHVAMQEDNCIPII